MYNIPQELFHPLPCSSRQNPPFNFDLDEAKQRCRRCATVDSLSLCLQVFVEHTWKSRPRDVRRLEALLEAGRLMLGET
ncbi:hypothetical protein V6Z12_D06G109500 [Gossypium hirsutum]